MARVKHKKTGKSTSSFRCKFRRFRIIDLKDIVRIEQESFPDPLSTKVLLFLVGSTDFIIVEENKQVVGYLSLGYENRDTRHIYRIAVSTSCRGKGFGTKILSSYVKKPCSVMTNIKNKGSIRFYERVGFRKVRRIKKKRKTLIYLRYG